MGIRTAIAWADSSWNPWRGCTKVSAGCAHCYMFREQERYGRDPRVVVRSKTTFSDPLRWEEPRRIFTCSWSDWFHPAADEWRPEAWEIVRRTPRHTYLILTKRPERIAASLPPDWGDGYRNVWLGVSGETIYQGLRRVAELRHVPARLRFLSAEPWLDTTTDPAAISLLVGAIDWVIVGGESGEGARPMDLGSARAVVEVAKRMGKPVFLKQLGGWPDPRSRAKAVIDGRRWVEMPKGCGSGGHVD